MVQGELTLNEDYYAIAYNHEISDWLQRCIESSARHPLVRETLIQYQNLINQLTMNSMDKNSQEELLELMSDPKNIDSICSILSLEAKWRERIFKVHVLAPLKEKFQGMDIELKNRGVNIKRPEWKQYIRLDWGNTLGKNAAIGITTNIAGPKVKQKSIVLVVLKVMLPVIGGLMAGRSWMKRIGQYPKWSMEISRNICVRRLT